MIQDIFIGSAPNDKTGTAARQAGQMINSNFAYLDNKITRKDGIVVSTGSAVSGNDITYNAFWQWIIDTIDYTNPVDVVMTFPFATTGFSRLDMIALTTSNTPIRIAGTESESNPISPSLPDNMIQAGFVLVTDSSVGDPSSPVIGDLYVKKMESQDFIANYGATTVINQIDLTDDRSSISLVGSATDVKSVQIPTAFIRPGKPHFFKNRTGHDVKLWHLAGTGNVKYFFPNGLDLTVKPNEVIEFNTNSNDSGNVRFEYVGNSADISSLAPKESPELTGTPTAPTAPIGTNTTQIATTEFVLANAVSNNFAPAVCFTFDDSYISQYNLLAVPFEARGVRFSQGVTFSYLGNTGMMSTAQVLDLEARGFEVLNHTATHLDLRDGTASTYANAISEIRGGHTSLVGLGMTPKGFISAYSAVKREFMPIIDNLYDNAYTIYQGNGAGIANPDIQVMNSPIHALRMNRVSMDQHNVAQCKAIIDRAVATNGVVTFYDHDPNGAYYPASASVSDILEIVDYAIASVGVSNIIKTSEIPARFNAIKSGGSISVDFKTTQSFPNITFTTTELNYAVESKDIKADVNGTFTVKRTGTYNIEGAWHFGTATATRVISAIEIDGTGVYRSRRDGYGSIGGASTQAYKGIMNLSITLLKGQTFKLAVFQDSGSAKTILGGGLYDYAKITRVS